MRKEYQEEKKKVQEHGPPEEIAKLLIKEPAITNPLVLEQLKKLPTLKFEDHHSQKYAHLSTLGPYVK